MRSHEYIDFSPPKSGGKPSQPRDNMMLHPETYHKLAAGIGLGLLFALIFSILVTFCGSAAPTAAEAQLPDFIDLGPDQIL